MPTVIALMLMLWAGVAAASGTGDRPWLEVVADPAPVIVTTHLSLSELAAIAQRAGQPSDSGPPGFHVSEVRHEAIVAPASGPDTTCASNLHTKVAIRLADRRIEVAREVRRQPWRFSIVLDTAKRKRRWMQRSSAVT